MPASPVKAKRRIIFLRAPAVRSDFDPDASGGYLLPNSADAASDRNWQASPQ